MNIVCLDKEYYWRAIIEWKPPCKWYKDEEGMGAYLNKKYKKEYGIYRFERRHPNQTYGRENLYIGIAFRQIFDERLHQGFHEYKFKNTKLGEIWVSLGIIDLKGAKHIRKRYEEIEKTLIYFTKPKLNERKKDWEPGCYFEIINKGYRGPLPKYIKYPVAGVR